jgi:hypothetical protein
MLTAGSIPFEGAAAWVREEFEYFWAQGVDLPDAVIKHVAAMANRVEYRSIEAAHDRAGTIAPDAILAERPIYKGGQILRSWQKRFVQTCVEDWKLNGKARYLLADDVGLGKTLSMAGAALVLSFLDHRPVLILAPATLVWQWQEELEDKLGIPAAVWSTQKKCWLDAERRTLTQKGDPEFVAKCPWRIGIVSTGLIVNGDDNGERGALAKKSFGVIILDEAHKARAQREIRGGQTTVKSNNLLEFLRKAARNAGSVILGTATPIQLDAVELWDLLAALNQGAPSPTIEALIGNTQSAFCHHAISTNGCGKGGENSWDPARVLTLKHAHSTAASRRSPCASRHAGPAPPGDIHEPRPTLCAQP